VNTSKQNAIYSRQWDVGSFTDPTKKPYKVSERRDGRWECSCPAWTRHTPRVDCKHIIKVQTASRFSPQNPAFVVAPSVESQPAVTALVSKPKACGSDPQGCAVSFDGYAIRRRALVERFDDDTLAGTETDSRCEPSRSRRDI
jgi:hypothetical protein